MNDNADTEPKRTHRVVRVARILLPFLLVLVVIRLTGCTESLAYWPSRDDFLTPANYQDVEFQTPDGLTLHGWFMPARDAVAPTPAVLHPHGNAGNISHHDAFSSFLTDHGISVLLFDYRGYGRSEKKGRLRRNKLLIDTQAALDYLKTRDDVDPTRIGIFGVSLGGAFALPVAAANTDVRCVVTLSTFETWRGVARDWMPVIGPMLFPAGLEPVDALPALAGRPMLIVHGDADKVINVRHANLLYQAAQGAGVDVELFISPGADHNQLIDTDPEARQRIADFFVEHLRD